MNENEVVVAEKPMLSGFQKKVGVLGLTALAINSASAAALDTAELVTNIAGASVAVAALAGASLTVFVGIKVFKWIKAAI